MAAFHEYWADHAPRHATPASRDASSIYLLFRTVSDTPPLCDVCVSVAQHIELLARSNDD